MLAACPDHVRQPPADLPLYAEATARVIIRRYPGLIPELMWETSHPESVACCTRGALAMSLTHAAIRKLLGR